MVAVEEDIKRINFFYALLQIMHVSLSTDLELVVGSC